MADRLCIYITGLPGAGKSTVGRYLSDILSIPMLDKDDYLEELFDSQGAGEFDWRKKLSREADVSFISDAKTKDNIILVSHWRPKTVTENYGTPSDWLEGAFDNVIEVYCSCLVNIAADRFTFRVRHPGHLDNSRSRPEIESWLSDYLPHLPIGFGRRISVSTVSEEWKSEIRAKLQVYF